MKASSSSFGSSSSRPEFTKIIFPDELALIGDSYDSNPQPLFEHVVDQLNPIGLAYVHVVEGDTGGARDNLPFDYAALRARFDGVWMVNNGYDRPMAIEAVASGLADLVSFGRAFLANPDLVERLNGL